MTKISKIHLICDKQGPRIRTYCGQIGDKTMVRGEYETELGNIFEAAFVKDLDAVSCGNCRRWYEREKRLKDYEQERLGLSIIR